MPEGFTVARRGRLVLLVLTTPLLLLLLLLLPLFGGLLSGNWALAAGAGLLAMTLVVGVVTIVRQHLRRTWSLDAVRPVPGGIAIAFSREVLALRLLGPALGGSAMLLWGVSAWAAGAAFFALLCTAAGGAVLAALVLWYVRGIRPGELT